MLLRCRFIEASRLTSAFSAADLVQKSHMFTWPLAESDASFQPV
jgi:hypothetical protein